MQIHFLGVGEACDGNQPNTSILLRNETDEKAGRILLDCGFSVPHSFLSLNPPAEELDVLWISHFHGDHFLGTPLLLLWFWEMNRSRPLNLIGPPGIKMKIEQAMDLAYPNFRNRLQFPLLFHEIKPGEQLRVAACSWNAAYNEHSQPCLSVRVEIQDKAIFYSGDGRPTPMTLALATGCDIIIHEAYGFEDLVPGHGSIRACLDFARKSNVKQLALVHMQRDVRLQCDAALIKFQKDYRDVHIILPEQNSTMSL
ncbi:MAG: MBL fold metallo-hydrolase [Deltaproteobacteria bacterium]|jgi:ribonuclease BN (tRNA processing enzyme)|nr:MBL fold metallo-hydrolase [Deltaproteobacteria bacterium]